MNINNSHEDLYILGSIIKFESVHEEQYLGGILDKQSKQEVELSSRLRGANETLEKMYQFWKHPRCRVRWKLQVYQAVISSRLLYGLESSTLTDATRFLGVRSTF